MVVKDVMVNEIIIKIDAYLQSRIINEATKKKMIWTRIDNETDELLKYLKEAYNVDMAKIIRKGIILYLQNLKKEME